MKHCIWIALFVLTISGCSSISTPSTPIGEGNATSTTKPVAAKDIHNWQLSGKIAVQTSKDSGSANVSWNQQQNHYRINLSGPLGSHNMLLSGQPGAVSLQASDGKTYRANSPEQLLASQWGFHLPVSNMNYWIRGLPVPGMPATTHYDQNGRLLSLNQAGWHIQYTSYTNLGNVFLPDKLSLGSANMKVKMIVYDWKI